MTQQPKANQGAKNKGLEIFNKRAKSIVKKLKNESGQERIEKATKHEDLKSSRTA